MPRFIDNATGSVGKIFAGNSAIQRECNTFRAKLLNESIKEAFRNKSFLERCQRRHELEMRQVDRRIFTGMKTSCKNVFEDTLRSARQRVERKLNVLKAQANQASSPTEAGKGDRSPPGPRDGEASTKRVTNLSSVPVSSDVTNVLSKGPKFALTKSIKNSTLQEVEAGVERLAYGKRWRKTF